ncbi:MAG: hypothetical protein KDI92_00240 [Xanthomonadales bacterium]|nr:hypothetical protein [Xanthomonadales bacterium]
MEKTKVKRLSDLGGIAGEEVLKEFNFYEHRWRRVLSAYAALEEEFESIFNEFGTVKKPGDVRKFLVDYQKGFAKNKLLATSYKPRNQNELNVLFTRLDALASLAGNWQKSPIRKSWGGANMPKPNASLRLVPGDIYSND